MAVRPRAWRRGRTRARVVSFLLVVDTEVVLLQRRIVSKMSHKTLEALHGVHPMAAQVGELVVF